MNNRRRKRHGGTTGVSPRKSGRSRGLLSVEQGPDVGRADVIKTTAIKMFTSTRPFRLREPCPARGEHESERFAAAALSALFIALRIAAISLSHAANSTEHCILSYGALFEESRGIPPSESDATMAQSRGLRARSEKCLGPRARIHALRS
jgi:hypothetical protein